MANDGLLHFWHVKIKRGFCFHLLLDPLCLEHVFGGGILSASDTTTVVLLIAHSRIDKRQQVEVRRPCKRSAGACSAKSTGNPN